MTKLRSNAGRADDNVACQGCRQHACAHPSAVCRAVCAVEGVAAGANLIPRSSSAAIEALECDGLRQPKCTFNGRVFTPFLDGRTQ